MNLYKKESITYENNSKRDIYSFEEIKSLEDLKNFMLLLKNQFGDLYDIIVKKDDGSQDRIFYSRYDTLDRFINSYNPSNFNRYNIYEFLGENLHIRIDLLEKLIDIYYRNAVYRSNNEKEYSYYLFENGMIVRYPKSGGCCDYLDNNNNWVYDNTLFDKIIDPAYKCEEIDNPLDGKKI